MQAAISRGRYDACTSSVIRKEASTAHSDLLGEARQPPPHVDAPELSQQSSKHSEELTGQLSSRRQASSVRSMVGACGRTASAPNLAASSAMQAQAASRTVWLLVRAQRT